MQRLTVLLLMVVCSYSFTAEQDVVFRDGSFVDSARDREVPFRIYLPQPLAGPYPVILISHGLGGSRQGNAQLGRHLAQNGFIAINLQHHGSDASLLEGARNRQQIQRALNSSLRDEANIVNRLGDIPFVVSQLPGITSIYSDLNGQFDLTKLGMAGHSYGAISTMVAAGQKIGAQMLSVKVPQILAGVVLSPSPPNAGIDLEAAYRDIDIPLFHMTGTNDQEPIASRNFQPEDRTQPYRNLTIPNQYLLVLKDAEHATFSGGRIGTRTEEPLDQNHMRDILAGATAFFKGYVSGDESSKQWLQSEYKSSLASDDVFEFK